MEHRAHKLSNSLNSLLRASALLFCGLSFISLPVHSAPFVLDDSFMDQVSAGNTSEQEGRGVIIGNSSDAVSNSKMGLDLTDEAQQGARGLNLVNSTESAVANTVNIWDGSTLTIVDEGSNTNPVLEVNQLNQVTQIQPQSATLSGYSRPDAEYTEVINRSGSHSHTSDLVNVSNVTDVFEEFRFTETTTDASIDTGLILELGDNLYIDGHVGQGVASSGYMKANFDGGEAEFALGINAGIKASAGITVEGILDNTSATLSASASAEVGVSFITKIELPAMELELSGAGCGVMLGSCDASSTSKELVITSTDNSSLEIFENHQTEQTAFSDEFIGIYRSSFELESAKATYIVVDDSSLELYSDVSLELSDSAQKDVEGMNIVNAIGSNVANSTNISRALQFNSSGTSLILNQFNVVHHGH